MKSLMTVLLTILLILASHSAQAQILELKKLDLSYKHYADSTRDPLFYDSTPKESIDLRLNMDLADIFFWDNLVHSMTNNSQYYMIGWNFQFGIHVTDNLSIQYEHYSKHLLDDRYPYQKFPVEDSIGFTYTIFKSKTGRGALFQ